MYLEFVGDSKSVKKVSYLVQNYMRHRCEIHVNKKNKISAMFGNIH